MADYGGAISLSQGRDLSHTSDDDDYSEQHSPRSIPTLSGSPCGGGRGRGSSSAKSKKPGMGSAGEISTKKPRGRPPGSKNKPKPPIVITKDSESGMKGVVLEISAGSDVVETLIHFARTRHVGITVLSGSGSVSNVTLRHPGTSVSHAPALMSLHGPFTLLSLSGSFVEYSTTTCPSSSKLAGVASASSFGICLAGAQGQVFGGIVGGKVIAATPVAVVAATFSNPAFHRLPTSAGSGGCGGGGGDRDHQTDDDHDGEAEQQHQETKHRCTVGNHHHHHHHHIESTNISSGSTSGSAMSMSVNYTSVAASPTPINCHITPDHHVLPWGPPSRSPY